MADHDPVREAEALLRRSRRLLSRAKADLLSADVTCALRAERIRHAIRRNAPPAIEAIEAADV